MHSFIGMRLEPRKWRARPSHPYPSGQSTSWSQYVTPPSFQATKRTVPSWETTIASVSWIRWQSR
jgi:hypothetical protein